MSYKIMGELEEKEKRIGKSKEQAHGKQEEEQDCDGKYEKIMGKRDRECKEKRQGIKKRYFNKS